MGNDANDRRRGFTLLELLVVLVLMSLMTALAVPRLAGTLAAANARASSRRIATALRYARNHAASEKAVYVAAFHPGAARVTVGRMPESARGMGMPAKDGLPLIDPRGFTLPDGVRIESMGPVSGEAEEGEPAAILFYPDGASSGGRVTVADEKGLRAAISVDGILGTVRLEE